MSKEMKEKIKQMDAVHAGARHEGNDIGIWLFNHVIWPLAQLLPFWWHSTYTQAGTQYHAWWRMWFGKVFDYHAVEVKAVIR